MVWGGGIGGGVGWVRHWGSVSGWMRRRWVGGECISL